MKMEMEIESLQYTNKIQAEVIEKFKDQLSLAQIAGKKAEIERDIARAKHSGLLREFFAFKSLIRHLGCQETDLEWVADREPRP